MSLTKYDVLIKCLKWEKIKKLLTASEKQSEISVYNLLFC